MLQNKRPKSRFIKFVSFLLNLGCNIKQHVLETRSWDGCGEEHMNGKSVHFPRFFFHPGTSKSPGFCKSLCISPTLTKYINASFALKVVAASENPLAPRAHYIIQNAGGCSENIFRPLQRNFCAVRETRARSNYHHVFSAAHRRNFTNEHAPISVYITSGRVSYDALWTIDSLYWSLNVKGNWN